MPKKIDMDIRAIFMENDTVADSVNPNSSTSIKTNGTLKSTVSTRKKNLRLLQLLFVEWINLSAFTTLLMRKRLYFSLLNMLMLIDVIFFVINLLKKETDINNLKRVN